MLSDLGRANREGLTMKGTETITRTRQVRIYKYKNMYGFITSSSDKVRFIEIEKMEEVIEVLMEQLVDTGETVLLEWKAPV